LGTKNKRLAEHRAEILEITKSILDLGLARQKLAQRIAKVKGFSGFAIEDHKVEETLSSEMIKYARSLGLDSDLAAKIVSNLIEYSKIAQRKEIFLPSIKSYLRSSKISTVSIFGAGRMGGWFAGYFSEANARVILFDENRKFARKRARELGCTFTDDLERALRSNLLVVAVPIGSVPSLIARISGGLETRSGPTFIMEISSVKTGLRNVQSKLVPSVKLFSIHPLFGPLANRFAENSLVQIGQDSGFIAGIFPHFKIFEMNIRDHDKLMATLLTIPHMHALSFAGVVSKKKIPKNIHSPSFDHLLELSRRILGESARVYYEIQTSNPFAKRAIYETSASIRRLQSLLKNRRTFEKFFSDAKHSI
jgi:prephenate dehydrogenase/chorismate mutase